MASDGRELPEWLFSRMLEYAVLQTVRLDAACVVVNRFDIPGQPALREACIENILRLKLRCDELAMPLMVEPRPTPFEPRHADTDRI